MSFIKPRKAVHFGMYRLSKLLLPILRKDEQLQMYNLSMVKCKFLTIFKQEYK